MAALCGQMGTYVHKNLGISMRTKTIWQHFHNCLIGKRMNCKIVEFRLSYCVLIVRRKTIIKKNIKINTEKNGG